MNAATLTHTTTGLVSAAIVVVGLHATVLGGETDADYTRTVDRLNRLAEAEIERGILTGVSVALVDDQKTVYAAGRRSAIPEPSTDSPLRWRRSPS